jgi:hypothetical protein
MSYLSPNFKVSAVESEEVVSAIQEDGEVNKYLVAENLGGGTPILTISKIEKDRMLLCIVGGTRSMWLYPNGKIKIER